MIDLRNLFGRDRANFLPAIAAAGVVLLVLVGVVMVMYNEQAYRDAKLQQVEAQSRILASTVTAALAFDDRKAAHEYVKALAVDPQIQVAAVYDGRGALFAGYSRTGGVPIPATVASTGPSIADDQLVVTAPVLQGATSLGTI